MSKYNKKLIVNASEEFLSKLEKAGVTRIDSQIAILCTMIAALTEKENLDQNSVVKLLIREMNVI